jgi:AraC-like DNA-binding protein
MVRAYRRKLKHVYSTVEGIDLRWLVMLMAVIALHWMFVVSRALLANFKPDAVGLIAVLDLFSITIFLAFTTTLVLKGLGQLRVFSGIDGERKYAGAKLPETDLQDHVAALSHYMERQKPYLVPSLTIDDLSRHLAIPSWRLSQVINRSFRQNFFNFVNGYRIEEAKKMLTDPKTSRKTILQILLEVGFNSKSSFNSAFKKHTGMTPKEFRKLNHG